MTMSTVHVLEPAYTLIERLGGKAEVAYHLDLDKSTLSRWCQPKPQGTGGAVPRKHWRGLMAMAAAKGVELKLEDLVGDLAVEA
jgi:hypothetical protein